MLLAVKPMQKKILIANGGYAEIPLIVSAKNEGFFVYVGGNNETAPGNRFADVYCKVDYSDPEALAKLIKTENIDYICSGCSDYSYKAVSAVCDSLGLPGHDDQVKVGIIHDKDKFRELVRDLGLPAPKSFMCTKPEDLRNCNDVKYPLMVKPVDAFGGNGISLCRNESELIEAGEEAFSTARNGRVVVEEFLEGTDHGFTVLIKDRKIVFWFSDNEYHDVQRFAVSAVSYPFDVSNESIDCLKEQVEKISERLELKDGLVHVQFKLLNDGTPVIIEICRRSPGDLYIEFVKYVTGFDYPRAILLAETGQDFEVPGTPLPSDTYCVRQVIICQEEGILNDIRFSAKISKYITDEFLYFTKGSHVKSMTKCGVIFLRFDSLDDLNEVMSNIIDEIIFDIQ